MSAKTGVKKSFGLIGYPLSHSFSKKYFTDKFLNEGTSKLYSYMNFEIDDLSSFPKIIADHPDLIGLNVTIPYKEKIIPYLSKLDGPATIIGAVNTIAIHRESKTEVVFTEGFNTDTIGFYQTLQPLLKSHHTGALVLGTGGASKAIIHALSNLNIPHIAVSRTPTPNSILYPEITKEILSSHPLIINTTPSGSSPEINSFPLIPYDLLGASNLLYDLVYNPAETAFLRMGKTAGAQIKNGYDMLIAQAEASWNIWNAVDDRN